MSVLEMQVGRVLFYLDAKFIDKQNLLIYKVKHKISVNILGREEKQRQTKYWKGLFVLFRLNSEEDLRGIQAIETFVFSNYDTYSPCADRAFLQFTL